MAEQFDYQERPSGRLRINFDHAGFLNVRVNVSTRVLFLCFVYIVVTEQNDI